MTRTMRQRIGGAALLVAGGLVTWLLIATSYDPFFVAGGTAPATIWGPALGAGAVAAGSALLLLAAAWRAGRARLVLLLLWLLFLAAATHRLVEHSDGLVEDVWLGVAPRVLSANSADEARRCAVGRWLARCDNGAGQTLTSVTAFPFAPLYPGRWTGQ